MTEEEVDALAAEGGWLWWRLLEDGRRYIAVQPQLFNTMVTISADVYSWYGGW